MMRLRINELIQAINQNPPESGPLHINDVASAIGVARTTLANVSTFTGERATSTRIVEALLRFFHRRVQGFEPSDLFDFAPPLGDDVGETIAELYPVWADRSRNG